MPFHQFRSAAVLLALVSSTVGIGTARVFNNCGKAVYFASVAQSVHANMAPLPSNGYAETYQLPNVGVSIKLALDMNGPVTQFEFTWNDGSINYDISNIDGYPFVAGGISLNPSVAGDASYPTCQPVNCPAGQEVCAAAYNLPDDVRTMVCPDSSDLVMTLCPGGPGTDGGSTTGGSTTDGSTTPTSSVVPATTPTSVASTPESTETGRPAWSGRGGHKRSAHRVHARHVPRVR